MNIFTHILLFNICPLYKNRPIIYPAASLAVLSNSGESKEAGLSELDCYLSRFWDVLKQG
jgi:hypothetical protein